MFVKKSILKVVAGVVTIVNAANADADAAHTRGLRAESLESRDVPAVNISAYVSIDEVEAFESLLPTNDRSDDSLQAESLESLASTTSIIKDEISSRIESDFVEDVIMFKQSSSSPTHDSIHGCVKAKDDVDLSVYISNAQDVGGDGQVRLCPGTIHFRNEIVLGDSITLSCAGTKGSCILDGNEATRHFVSDTADLTFTFIDLVLINGLADDSSTSGPFGGSLRLNGSTNIIDGSLFYNNRATSSTVSV